VVNNIQYGETMGKSIGIGQCVSGYATSSDLSRTCTVQGVWLPVNVSCTGIFFF